MQIKQKTFKAIIKPNSSRNRIIDYDENKKAYKINIKAKPEDNKANVELMKFLSKVLGKKLKIKSGCQKPPIRDGWHVFIMAILFRWFLTKRIPPLFFHQP
tara:strand:+ start:24481 stop:24783 length:303 start_codon:yes stop_codon:yes gene_type:complete